VEQKVRKQGVGVIADYVKAEGLNTIVLWYLRYSLRAVRRTHYRGIGEPCGRSCGLKSTGGRIFKSGYGAPRWSRVPPVPLGLWASGRPPVGVGHGEARRDGGVE